MRSLRTGLNEREIEILCLLADGRADKEIAARLHLSLNTVKWYNRQIYNKLGVSSRTKAVSAAEKLGLMDAERVSQKPPERIPNNLPAPVSSFVGRENEIPAIIDLLQSHRLVTLTGPGGVGKTRLALEVASALLADRRYPDGVYSVELAAVFQPDRVADAIREALRIQSATDLPAREALRLFFKGKNILLVLDNYEHLLTAGLLVGELLRDHPNLSILTTSREELRLSGEQLYPLYPLAIPVAAALFVQRAREVMPGFDPTESDLSIIDQICSRLDGLPLAVELAAAWMKIFQPADLMARLGDRFSLLTRAPRDAPERHQSLQAAIDWSYGLLNGEEQTLFRRLAVFQGSRRIDAVDSVCCCDLDLDAGTGLDSLLSKSLIKEKPGLDQEPRFIMLETIQEYARVQLQESGEWDLVQARHAQYYAGMVEQVRYSILNFAEERYWVSGIKEDFDNIRIILDRAVSRGEQQAGLRLVACLSGIWIELGYSQEGLKWAEWALDQADDASLDVRAGIYEAAGSIYFAFYEYQKSKVCFERAIDYYHQLGYKRDLGWVHIQLLPMIYWVDGDDPFQVMHHASQGFEMLTEVGDIRGLAAGWTYLAMHGTAVKDYTLNVQANVKRFRIGQELVDRSLMITPMAMIGACQLRRGRPRIGEACFKKWLSWTVALFGPDAWISEILDWLAGAALAQGNPWRAAVLQSAADALRGNWEAMQEDGVGRFYYEMYRNQTVEQLDKGDYQAAQREGQSMSFDEIVAYALGDGEPIGIL